LFVKIKEKVDISIIDNKVKRLNDDFAKLFTMKNNYPNILLKINRILLIFGEEKITKIYELVKYIANIETSKINKIHLISSERNSYNFDNSNSKETLEEYKDFEKIKSFKNKDFYRTVNYSNITNISSEIQQRKQHNCIRNSETKSSRNSCDSFGNKQESSSNTYDTYPGMLNIKCVKKEKNFDNFNRRFNSQEKNFVAKEIHENELFSNNENIKDVINIKNAPIMLFNNKKSNLNYENGNLKNDEFTTSSKLTDKDLFSSRDKFSFKDQTENNRNISEGNFKQFSI